jgi:hypothetical protein
MEFCMTIFKLIFSRKFLLIGLVGLLAMTGFALPGSHPLAAQTGPGTIAYVRPNDETGDEIWLIEPNGSGNRRIWSTGQAPSVIIKELRSLAWRPDAGELAFVSNHEEFLCSIYASDIYSIHPDGSGYRRITNAPACAEFENYSKGTVEIEVENQGMFGAHFSVYFQGATEYQGVSVASGQIETVTFTDVADFGPNILQYAVAINWQNVSRRSWGAPVDVQAGNTVKARLLITNDDALPEFGAKRPTWRSDGAKIGYVLSLGYVSQIDAFPAPPALFEPLLANGGGAITVQHLAWSPAPAMANQLLYAGDDGSDSNGAGIYRILEGDAGLGERLVSPDDSWESVLGLAWLPDGSGFVYAITESWDPSANIDKDSANIFAYDFASGQTTRLTYFNGEFARQLSVSPDGQQIVFERATAEWWDPEVDLWVMDRDGSDLRLLVQNGYAPAWSPREPQVPTPTATATPTHTSTPTATDTPTHTPISTSISPSTPISTQMPAHTSTPTAPSTPMSTPASTHTPPATSTPVSTDMPAPTPIPTEIPERNPRAVLRVFLPFTQR